MENFKDVENVTIIDHPLIKHKITMLRPQNIHNFATENLIKVLRK